jgi:capsid portal protein
MQEINGSDVSMLSVKKAENDFTTSKDDFNQPADEVMKLSGLSHNFRRAAKRKIEKADNNSLTGDGSSSKQIVPDKYGYGIFDVVEAPYNMNSLSRIYEVSAANFAAINAKVSNVVGLGYSLDPSLSVMQALEDINDPERLSRARKKIDRARESTIEWLESRNDEDTFTATLMKALIDKESTGNGYL